MKDKYALKLAQEDSDDGVPLKVMHRPFFQEDISFIDEHDGTPARRYIEYLGQSSRKKSRRSDTEAFTP